jgi:hypothetical protein
MDSFIRIFIKIFIRVIRTFSRANISILKKVALLRAGNLTQEEKRLTLANNGQNIMAAPGRVDITVIITNFNQTRTGK